MDGVSNFSRCSARGKHAQNQLLGYCVCINLSRRTFLRRRWFSNAPPLSVVVAVVSPIKALLVSVSVCNLFFHGLKMKNNLPESLSHVESRRADSSQRRGPKYWRSLQREKLSLSLSRSLSDSRSLSAVRRRLLVLPRLKKIQRKFHNCKATSVS